MFEYYPGTSLLHRLDVRTKVLGFAMLTVLAFLFSSPAYNLVLAFISLAVALYVGLTFKKVAARLQPLIVIFVLIILLTGISYPPAHFATSSAQRVLLHLIDGIYLTVGGLAYGLTLLLRILVMVLVSSALIYCTPLDDFLQFLQKLRMPYQLAFVLTTAIRFVPTMEGKASSIIDAQKARGSQIGTGRFLSRIRTYVPIMVPLLVESVRMSETLAVAMLNRGYGAHKTSTPLRELHMVPLDYVFCAAFAILILAGILLSVRGWGSL